MAALAPLAPEGWTIRLLCLGLALPAFALGGLALFHPLHEIPASSEVRLDNELGEVRVSSRTISDFLQRRTAQIEGVESLKIRVQTPEGGKVSLRVEASVMGDLPLPTLTRRIQTFIEEELKTTIGLEGIEGVHILFRKIGGAEPPALPAPSTAPAPNRQSSADRDLDLDR